MKALTLQQMNVASGEQQQQLAACGRNLTSNFCPSLENNVLSQTSTMNPRSGSSLFPTQLSYLPSLQPTSLSSTSSLLLSTPFSADSPLLSTQNKLLATDSSNFTSSLISTVPSHSLVTLSLTEDPLLGRFADPPTLFKHGLGGEKKMGAEEDEEEISEEMESSFEETSVVCKTIFISYLQLKPDVCIH